jgi:hypothetical protein
MMLSLSILSSEVETSSSWASERRGLESTLVRELVK